MTIRKRPRCSACRVLEALLLAACHAGLAGAQLRSPAPHAPQQDTGAYGISGVVVDAISGSKLSRCTVEVVDVKHDLGAHTTLTDEDGHFIFQDVPVSKYRLSASKRGFLTQSYEEHDNLSTAIAVGPGLVSEDLTFKLTPNAILSGTVTDDAGEPVRQAQIKLFRDQDADGIRTTQQHSGAMTDDRGFYEIGSIAPGAYFVSVSARPWYAVQQHNSLGSENAALDVAYPTTFYPDVTDADSATPIPVKGGERLQADFILHAEHAVRLRIPVPIAEIRQGYGLTVSHLVFGQQENLSVTMTSSGSGALEVDGLLPGHYDVSLMKNFSGRPTETHFSADVSEDSAQVSGEENASEVIVTGKLTSSEGRLPLHAGMALVMPHTRRTYFAPADAAGEFTVSVPPGTYEVLGQINQHYLASVSASGGSLVGRLLTLKAGDAPRLQVSVGNSYGQIDGVVMHDGKPSSAAMVLLVPDRPGANHILFRRDQSDSDGTFTLPGIVPGHYRVVAIERGWELEWANPRTLAPFLQNSKQVDVRGSDHLQTTVELQTR